MLTLRTEGLRPYLLNESGVPLIYPNLFLVSHLAKSRYNTVFKYMETVRRVEEFCEIKGVDPISRMARLEPPFTDDELGKLGIYFSLERHVAEGWLKGKVIISDDSNELRVQRQTEAGHWNIFRRYMQFLFDKTKPSISRPSLSGYVIVFEDFLRNVSFYKPSGRNASSAYEIRALPPFVFYSFYERVLNSPQCLFEENSKFELGRTGERDRIALLLAAVTGCRAGELVNIRRRDIVMRWNPSKNEMVPFVVIQESRDEVAFRKEGKKQKYIAKNKSTGRSNRLIPIPQQLKQLIDEYLQNGFFFRAKVNAMKKHGRSVNQGYLFVKEDGTPLLSSDYLRDILRKIEPKVLDLIEIDYGDSTTESIFYALYPHVLRHSRATSYMHEAEEQGLDMAKAEDNLRVFMGWERGSDQPNRYAAAFVQMKNDATQAEFTKRTDLLIESNIEDALFEEEVLEKL